MVDELINGRGRGILLQKHDSDEPAPCCMFHHDIGPPLSEEEFEACFVTPMREVTADADARQTFVDTSLVSISALFASRVSTTSGVVGLLTFITDVHSAGLDSVAGIYLAEQFYWDENDASRTFAKRFFAVEGKMPTKIHASTYVAVRHYLETVGSIGNKKAREVNLAMQRRRVDYFGKPASIRADGRVIYDLGLYEVKAPSASHSDRDLYTRIGVIEGATGFRPMGAGCSLG